jgi:general secretion pathway protein J
MRIAQKGRAGGFTLVELLLAVTLMGMLLALAYGGFRAATRAADRGQEILEDGGRIRMAHQFVRRQLNQMLPLAFAEDENEGLRLVFVGDARRILFVGPMPGYLGFGGPQVQELALVDDDDGMALVLNHALLQGFEEPLLYERDPVLLLDKIESGSFSFLGLDENGEPLPWATSWGDPDMLPEAVALDLEFRDEVYIDWPMLAAGVRLDVEGTAAERDYGNAIQDLIRKSRRERQ